MGKPRDRSRVRPGEQLGGVQRCDREEAQKERGRRGSEERETRALRPVEDPDVDGSHGQGWAGEYSCGNAISAAWQGGRDQHKEDGGSSCFGG